jgi:integrase
MPRGRKPQVNWTPSLNQYTTTIRGTTHKLGTDKKEAERTFNWLMAKAGLGEAADLRLTFSDVADDWLGYVEKVYSAKRYRICKARLTEFVRFVGAELRVNDLRPNHVETWLKAKADGTLPYSEKARRKAAPYLMKPGTERLYKAVVLACLNWAAGRKVKLIPANPLKGLLDLPEGDSRGGDTVWPTEVYETVLRVANPAFANVVRILAWTGARPSTVCKVEARHYLPDLSLWDVEDLYKGRKSKRKYVRRIWLSPQAIELVERLNREHPEGPIFRNSKDRVWSPDTLAVYLHNLQHKFSETKKLAWPEGLCLYGLRHTFATGFIREHPDKLEYLRELLGHKDLKMIRLHYGHLFDEHEAMHKVLASFRPV